MEDRRRTEAMTPGLLFFSDGEGNLEGITSVAVELTAFAIASPLPRCVASLSPLPSKLEIFTYSAVIATKQIDKAWVRVDRLLSKLPPLRRETYTQNWPAIIGAVGNKKGRKGRVRLVMFHDAQFYECPEIVRIKALPTYPVRTIARKEGKT